MIKITDARVKQSNLLESVESIGHLIYTNAFRPLPSLEKKKKENPVIVWNLLNINCDNREHNTVDGMG